MIDEENKSVCEQKNYKNLYDQHAAGLRNFLYYRCGNLAKAEDFMHEAFIKLWQNCKKVIFDKAKSFLFTVGNRLFLSDIEHQKVVMKFEKNNAGEQLSETPEFTLEEKEFKAKLENAIGSLPEKQRVVFLMNRIDKKSYKEIAELMEISVKAVEKRMHNALLNLKEAVDELEKYKF